MECAAHSSLDIQISKGPTEVRIGWAVRVRQLDAASQICMQRRAHAACGVSLPGCLGSIARRASGSVRERPTVFDRDRPKRLGGGRGDRMMVSEHGCAGLMRCEGGARVRSRDVCQWCGEVESRLYLRAAVWESGRSLADNGDMEGPETDGKAMMAQALSRAPPKQANTGPEIGQQLDLAMARKWQEWQEFRCHADLRPQLCGAMMYF